jgi:branched-chain amino acid transport system substrate-binding protein
LPSARLSKWSSAAATRGFFLTADYAFGHSLERGATQVIVQNGGKVIGSVAHPFTTPDLSSFILQAQFSKGKIIGLASGPPDNVDAIKLVGESGIFTGGQQMAGLLVLITDVHALGLKAAQGLLLTTSFDCDMDDKTREWSKRFFAKIDRIPTMWQAGVLFVGDPLSQGDPSHRHRRSA